tara:strand:- start:588 stop:803 length:216 start_codon:yes stop_codon:yes gene_type:complete
MSNVREEAQQQAEVAYDGFIKFSKYVAYTSILFLLVVAKCNFGVDGTGSKYEPNNAREYEERMIEMGKQYK